MRATAAEATQLSGHRAKPPTHKQAVALIVAGSERLWPNFRVLFSLAWEICLHKLCFSCVVLAFSLENRDLGKSP